VARFLPALRKRQPAARTDEHKVVFADYYTALASSGITSSYRARPWSPERAVAEAYERIIWVFKAVEAISTHSSRLPYKIKKGEKKLEDHPLYRVVNQRANPLETSRQFRQRLCAQVLLSKRGAFVELTRSRGGDITRLDLLPPGRTRPVPGRGEELVSHYEVVRADGSIQEIEPERVRWFRSPHPLDPYCGVTPLEAAGLSVELDLFTRLYNVNFLRNDARPGGVLAIDGEMREEEMDRVESRFGKGPVEAGKLTVINGEVSYVDLATRPRDMAYEISAKTSKTEILTAFGVPESLLGFSADRTYSNAEQEHYNFWTITMPPILDLLATGFDEDSTDDLEGFFDTSDVEVLQRSQAKVREEARREFELGLITPDEYRERAGYDVVDMPEARALYIPSGKKVVPTSKEDAKKIAEAAAAAAPPPLAANAQGVVQQAVPGKKPPALPRAAQSPEQAAARAARKQPGADDGGGRALRVVKAATDPDTAPSRPVLRLARGAERKALEAAALESVPDTEAAGRLEAGLAATLTALIIRLMERSAARTLSPKTRKGTRHWEVEHKDDTRTGDDALDAARIVEEDRWRTEAETAVAALLATGAQGAATALLADLHAPAGLDPEDAAQGAAVAVTAMIGDAAARQGTRLAQIINTADQDGLGTADIIGKIREQGPILTRWASSVAHTAATAATAAARDAAAALLATSAPDSNVQRQWRAHRDPDTRDTHRAAHGQHQPLGEPFEVGEALLRYPGDPLGPPGETINCRCGLTYRARDTGRYAAAPVAS
jgi:HK97 family phage portal protein